MTPFKGSKLIVNSMLSLLISASWTYAAESSKESRDGFNPTVLTSPNSATDQNFTKDLKRLFDLTDRIMTHKVLYKFLNEAFEPLLQISPELQKTYGWPEKSKGLSETQVLFMLREMPDYWDMLDEYLTKVTPENFEQPEIKEVRASMRKKFKELISQDHILEKVQQLVSPAEPLALRSNTDLPGYSAMKAFINHPSLDLNSNKIINRGDDLKAVVLAFIKGAKKSLTFNVFEFNLPDVAQALIKANQTGVTIAGGIDSKTTTLGPANSSVFATLQKAESNTFKVIGVDSVGLNHQKVIVRDAGTPDAAVLFLSGNFTQSCIGPEGDAVALPKNQRPKQSLPNANHAILVKGELPALIAERELNKTIFKNYRGQSGYPISGSYIVYGPQKTGEPRSYMVIAFSPNGGMGEVNRDIIKRTVLSTKGSIWAMHFAFSSPEIVSAIETRMQNAQGKAEFRAVGDPPFAMREWSGFLLLSGLNKNLDTLKYGANSSFNIFQGLSNQEVSDWQNNIRVNPKIFGEFHSKVNGEAIKVSVKLHHKVFIFPEDGIAIAGTSFNPSNNAESNQEQILVISDRKVVDDLMGGFHYLYKSSPMSVTEYAKYRNDRNVKDTEPAGPEADFVKAAAKAPATVTPAPVCNKIL